MRTNTKLARQPLTRLGGPAVGTVTALALAPDQGHTVFVGARAGLFRASTEAGQTSAGWERLANAPVGILALAVSPAYAHDRQLVAGTNTGLFYSTDGGDTWRTASTPLTESTVTVVAFSPHFAEDGLVLAGTLEDGILNSTDRGERYFAKSFGLLDASVLAIGFSPAFAQDGTIYLGTETTAYHSYNGGLAWKELNFPPEAAPVLSLALSDNFAGDNTLHAGTEQAGLFRSTDRGLTWQPVDLPASTINALAQAEGALLAATEAGVFRSADGGQTWEHLLDLPNVIALAASPVVTVAGVVDRGVWLSTDRQHWQALPGLSARSMLGLALAPHFDREPVAFMYGPQEGLWRTRDGGQTWDNLDANLPSQDIAALALSPNFEDDRTVVVGALEGVSVSTDAGETWERRADPPADAIAYSPSGQLMLVNFPVAGLRVSVNHGQTWMPFPGPWDRGGKVAAAAVSDTGHFYVAYLEGVGETLTLWQGQPKQIEKVLSEPAGHNPLVALYVPKEPSAEGRWYAAWGHQVWTLRAGSQGDAPVAASVFDPDGQLERLTGLTGGVGPSGPVLFATTGRHIYQSTDGQDWTEIYDFGQERAVALTLSPTFASDQTAYALLLGGSMCKLTLA
jgi:photosystem II stability/assembly factor-like uncharacterized protein